MNGRPRDANLLGALALTVADRMAAAVEAATPHGSTGPAALVALHEFLAGASMDALARVLGLTPSGAVRLVDRLAADGLVERRPAGDGRAVAIVLTPAGRRAAVAIRTARATALEAVLDALDPSERAALARLHEKLLAGLTDDHQTARRTCRLCDVDACGHHRGTCPVTEAVRAA